MSAAVRCQGCNQPRSSLKAYNSKIVRGMRIILCDTCASAGHEPRYLIILVARQGGHDTVKEYIQKRRYSGEEIAAADILS